MARAAGQQQQVLVFRPRQRKRTSFKKKRFTSESEGSEQTVRGGREVTRGRNVDAGTFPRHL